MFRIGLLEVRWLKHLHNAFFTDVYILFLDEDSDSVTFSSDEKGILSVDLNNTKVDDLNFYEDYPETIIHVRLMAWHKKLK